MNKLIFAAIMGFCALASAAPYSYRPLGVTNIKKPAQVEFLDLTVGNYSGNTLVVSQFAPFSAGDVQVLPNPGAAAGKWSSAQFQSIATGSKLKWPNLVTKVPTSIHPNAVVVADGFLVPGASDGGVYALIGEAGSWTKSVCLTTVKKGYFFHKVEFVDMNGDGKLDILTARATKSIFGSSGGELLWLENPGSLTGSWKEHVVVQGPDVMFEVVELDGDDATLDLIATQFFSNKVAVYFLSKKDGSLVDQVLIDDSIGAAYNVEIWDLNADGKKQLLINNHDGSSSKSALFAYEIPSDPKTGKWTRHTLASGFATIASGFGQASPGFSYGFHPKVDATNEKPYILIAGDGTKSAFLLTPDATTPFKYSSQEIVKTKGVVGSIGISDVDGDGFVEFFVPDYDGNQLYAYSFSPAQ